MTFQTFCNDYIALVAIACTFSGLVVGALMAWLWMRWRYRHGMEHQRYLKRGLFGGK